MSKKLDEIRIEIDSIDNQVHDLLMQRADLVSSVSTAKKKDGLQIVQPAREAKMMRRLLSRHKGPLPRATIVRIWRELVGSVSLLQAGLSVVVSPDVGEHCYWDMAKNYFGSAIPMKQAFGSLNAITAVKTSDASFAVMPWPGLAESSPWWLHLLDQEGDEKMSIICALPYGRKKANEKDVYERAVVVSKIDFMPSDDDISFIGLRLNSKITRALLVETAEKLGVSVISAFTGYSAHDAGTKMHLLEVEGFWDKNSEVIGKLQGIFGEQCLYCATVGGYPVIPDVV